MILSFIYAYMVYSTTPLVDQIVLSGVNGAMINEW
jgi:hypothetical protein